MPTHRRVQFEAWWQERISGEDGDRFLADEKLEDIAWAAWRQSANLYADKYAHISGDSCEERLEALDKVKDTSFAKMQQHLRGEVERYAREAAIRKEVHRDDYLRSGILLAALKQILLLVEQKPEQSDKDYIDQWIRCTYIESIARKAIVEVWGTSPTKHCDKHAGYRPSCPDCRAIGRSLAREDAGPTESDQSS